MNPVVLIFSEGNVLPKDIAENIIKANGENIDIKQDQIASCNCMGYNYNIKTKYYENSIVLIPLDCDVDQADTVVKECIEGLIVYFDIKNKNVLQRIAVYSNFIKTRKIENGLILFDNIDNTDISYIDLQSASNFLLDIIELNRSSQNQNDGLEDFQTGYEEVLQTLYTFAWSNIHINKKGSKDLLLSTNDSESSEDDVECQMEVFENLLMKIQAFKSVSTSMEREDVLNHAEQLASQFVKLMNSDVENL